MSHSQYSSLIYGLTNIEADARNTGKSALYYRSLYMTEVGHQTCNIDRAKKELHFGMQKSPWLQAVVDYWCLLMVFYSTAHAHTIMN